MVPHAGNAKALFNQFQVTEWLDPATFNLITVGTN